MGRPSFRRRKFFIKKEFQGKFIAFYTIGVIAMAGATTLILNKRLHTVVDEQLYSSHMKVHRTGELFLTPLIQTNMYAMLAISIAILIFSVVVFKRLNRHFTRMHDAFEEMTKDNYSSYDPQASRFEEISQMIDMVRQAQDLYGERMDELKRLTGYVQTALDAGCPPEQIHRLHESLSAAVRQIRLPETV